MNATADLTTATPAEIDAQLAELYGREGALEGRLASALSDLHYGIGERPVKVVKSTGRKTWPTTDAAAVEAARAKLAAGAGMAWDMDSLTRRLAKYDAVVAELAGVAAAMVPLHAEYRNRPWTRFHPVPDGHIHSSRACHTLRITTDVRWLPEMSGQDEATALAALGEAGHILCTVCYPSAPVIERAPRPTREQQAATRAAAAERARVEDPKLIADVDGSPLRVDGSPLRTVRSAEIAGVDHLYWAAYARHIGRRDESYARQHEGHTAAIVAALAHKAGTTEAEVRAALTVKAVAKVKRDLGADIAAAAAAVWAA